MHANDVFHIITHVCMYTLGAYLKDEDLRSGGLKFGRNIVHCNVCMHAFSVNKDFLTVRWDYTDKNSILFRCGDEVEILGTDGPKDTPYRVSIANHFRTPMHACPHIIRSGLAIWWYCISIPAIHFVVLCILLNHDIVQNNYIFGNCFTHSRRFHIEL